MVGEIEVKEDVFGTQQGSLPLRNIFTNGVASQLETDEWHVFMMVTKHEGDQPYEAT